MRVNKDVLDLVKNYLYEEIGSSAEVLIEIYISNFKNLDLEEYQNQCFDKSQKITPANIYEYLCLKYNHRFDALYTKTKSMTHGCKYLIAYYMLLENEDKPRVFREYNFVNGINIINAGPGTGKTTWAVNKCKSLMEDGILVLGYTNKSIDTFVTMLKSDLFFYGNVSTTGQFSKKIFLLTVDSLACRLTGTQSIYQEDYTAVVKRANITLRNSDSHVLSALAQLFSDNGVICWKHIIVDEAQMLDKERYDFVQRFYTCMSAKSLSFIGDPSQSIMSYNSDCPFLYQIKERMHNIINFTTTYRYKTVETLGLCNYISRCVKGTVTLESANTMDKYLPDNKFISIVHLSKLVDKIIMYKKQFPNQTMAIISPSISKGSSAKFVEKITTMLTNAKINYNLGNAKNKSAESIVIDTIHASIGKEYGVVFLLMSGFPDQMSNEASPIALKCLNIVAHTRASFANCYIYESKFVLPMDVEASIIDGEFIEHTPNVSDFEFKDVMTIDHIMYGLENFFKTNEIGCILDSRTVGTGVIEPYHVLEHITPGFVSKNSFVVQNAHMCAKDGSNIYGLFKAEDGVYKRITLPHFSNHRDIYNYSTCFNGITESNVASKEFIAFIEENMEEKVKAFTIKQTEIHGCKIMIKALFYTDSFVFVFTNNYYIAYTIGLYLKKTAIMVNSSVKDGTRITEVSSSANSYRWKYAIRCVAQISVVKRYIEYKYKKTPLNLRNDTYIIDTEFEPLANVQNIHDVAIVDTKNITESFATRIKINNTAYMMESAGISKEEAEAAGDNKALLRYIEKIISKATCKPLLMYVHSPVDINWLPENLKSKFVFYNLATLFKLAGLREGKLTVSSKIVSLQSAYEMFVNLNMYCTRDHTAISDTLKTHLVYLYLLDNHEDLVIEEFSKL